MNPQASELNKTITEFNPVIFNLLSKKGQKIFFPKSGILAQSQDAKNKKFNATIGVANEEDGTPMVLDSISQKINLDKKICFPYAPSFGVLKLRKKWQTMMKEKNPSLQNTSLPVVSSALTHGISIIGYLFINPEEKIISPDLFWGNYRLILEQGHQGKIETFKTFQNNKFNIEGLKEKLMEEGKKKIIILNFPNNPSGYTPTNEEAHKIAETLKQSAESGKEIIAITDDSYFGLVYEEGIYSESIFSLLSNLHPNILAIKIDGVTKEDYAWGFRVGFVTYGNKDASQETYQALENKTAGAIRGNLSSVSHLSQSLILSAFKNPNYQKEKSEKYQILKSRYLEVKKIIKENLDYQKYFQPLPFNSGYFMCLKLNNINAEKLRQHLLTKYDTGVISINESIIRVAFSGVPLKNTKPLFKNIYQACQDLS